MSTTSLNSSTESRALDLLGQGLSPEVVASALGVSPSRISQLISDPEFFSQVADLRYKSLARHNARDSKADAIEDQILDKLKDCLAWVTDPMKLVKAYQVLNAAKRRGSSTPEHITSQQTVINLVLPTQILQNFTVNSSNQVVKTGQQDLITVQSSQMSKLLESNRSQNVEISPTQAITSSSNS